MSHTVRPMSAPCFGALHRLDRDDLPDEHERTTRSDRRSPCASGRGRAGSRSRSERTGLGQRERVAERRHLVEQERRVEREVRALPVRREHRMHLEAGVVRHLRELETARPTLGRVREQRERVEVQRAPRRACHRQHELAIGVVVAVEERARNELDRAAAHLAQHRTPTRSSSSGLGVIARYAAPVVGDVQFQLARREADRTLVERGAHQRAHLRDLVVGRGCAPTRRRPSRTAAPRSARRSRRR